MDCVTCAYPMIYAATGHLKDLRPTDDVNAKETLKKHNIELEDAEDRPVGCYVCPKCGHCVWLET